MVKKYNNIIFLLADIINTFLENVTNACQKLLKSAAQSNNE